MNKRNYKIGIHGLNATERATVGSLCILSQHRSCSYQVVDNVERSHVDIALVDGDSDHAQRDWVRSSAYRAGQPALLVLSDPADVRGRKAFAGALNRHYLSARLMRTLDEAVSRHPALSREFVVEDSGDVFRLDPGTQNQYQVFPGLALIIDDSMTVREQMSTLLEDLGMKVEVAHSAETGLRMAEQRPFDLIFLDVELPEMDGYSACRKLKSRRGQPDCPVVMLTGRDSAFDRIRGIMAGCNRYLTKPVSVSSLVRVIEEFSPANLKQAT